VAGTDLGFGGEVADLYHRFRRGYAAAVIDVLADAFQLSTQVSIGPPGRVLAAQLVAGAALSLRRTHL